MDSLTDSGNLRRVLGRGSEGESPETSFLTEEVEDEDETASKAASMACSSSSVKGWSKSESNEVGGG